MRSPITPKGWLWLAGIVAAIGIVLLMFAGRAQGDMYPLGVADGRYALAAAETETPTDPWAGIIDRIFEIVGLVLAAGFAYVLNMLRAWLKRKGAKDAEIEVAQQIVNALHNGVMRVGDGLKQEFLKAKSAMSNGGTKITDREAAMLRQKAFELAMQSATSDEARAALSAAGAAAWDRWINLLVDRDKKGGTTADIPAMIAAEGLAEA